MATIKTQPSFLDELFKIACDVDNPGTATTPTTLPNAVVSLVEGIACELTDILETQRLKEFKKLGKSRGRDIDLIKAISELDEKTARIFGS